MLSLLRKTKNDKDKSRYFVRNWNEIFRNYRWMKLSAVWRYYLCQAVYEVAVTLGIIIVIVVAPEILSIYQEVIEAFNDHDYSEDTEELSSTDNEIEESGESKETYSIPTMEPPRGTTGDIVVKADTEKSAAAAQAAKEAAAQADTRAKSESEKQQEQARQQQAERDSLREQAEAKAQEAIEKADAVPGQPHPMDLIETVQVDINSHKEDEANKGGLEGLINTVIGVIDTAISDLVEFGNLNDYEYDAARDALETINSTLEEGGLRGEDGKVDVDAVIEAINEGAKGTITDLAGAVVGPTDAGQEIISEDIQDYAQALADYFDAKDEAQQAQQEAQEAQEAYENAPTPTETSDDTVTSETSYTTEYEGVSVDVTETTYADGSSTVTAVGEDGSTAYGGTDTSGGTGLISTDSEGNTTYEYTDSEGNTSTYTESSPSEGEGGDYAAQAEASSPAQPPDGSGDDLDGNDISGGT